jgi:hypothetical protein
MLAEETAKLPCFSTGVVLATFHLPAGQGGAGGRKGVPKKGKASLINLVVQCVPIIIIIYSSVCQYSRLIPACNK